MNNEIQEEIRKQRSWIGPKEIRIQSINYSILAQKLLIETIKDKKESEFFIKLADIEISEQITKLTIEEKKVEKERIIRDLDNNYYTKLADIELRKLKEKLKIEENILAGIHDKIKKLERNHTVEKSKDKETEEVKATADLLEKEEVELNPDFPEVDKVSKDEPLVEITEDDIEKPSEAKEWDYQRLKECY